MNMIGWILLTIWGTIGIYSIVDRICKTIERQAYYESFSEFYRNTNSEKPKSFHNDSCETSFMSFDEVNREIARMGYKDAITESRGQNGTNR